MHIKKERWLVPENIDPIDRRCVIVMVPNDQNHIAAFWAALRSLQFARNWKTEDPETGNQLGAVWRGEYLAARARWDDESCDNPVQFRQLEPCVLQISYDNGASWATIFHGFECGELAARSVIEEMISGGEIEGFGLYNYSPAGWPNTVITPIGPLKWHVEIGIEPDLPFVPYAGGVAYGRINPAPVTQECVRYMISNVTGWSEDEPPPGPANSTKYPCSGDPVVEFHDPSIFSGDCMKQLYTRSVTAVSYDVEIVKNC